MKQGFVQALGVLAYCLLVGLFMWNANSIVGQPKSFLGPVAFLTLFSTSALVCALIVGFKPYQLFLAGKKKEAVNVILSTAVFLFIFLILTFAALLLIK